MNINIFYHFYKESAAAIDPVMLLQERFHKNHGCF
jgi:hypothetical protein